MYYNMIIMNEKNQYRTAYNFRFNLNLKQFKMMEIGNMNLYYKNKKGEELVWVEKERKEVGLKIPKIQILDKKVFLQFMTQTRFNSIFFDYQ